MFRSICISRKSVWSTALIFLTALSLSAQVVSYSFTTAGATGSLGPIQTQLNNAYSSTNLNGAVTAGNTGIQTWIVPVTGPYRIEAWGASGGNRLNSPNHFGGLGAYISGEFNLTQGDVVRVLVGQKGVDGANTASGGGGSFIEVNNVLLVAAGAGGGATGDQNAANGTTLTAGTNDFPGGSIPGGVNGGGGQVCNNSGTNHGGGGGGYNGDGATSTLANAAFGGSSFQNGGTGGASTVPGGFGGGGGATMSGVSLYGGGGGGGGYSGGAGGQQVNHCTPGIDRSGGGGGGSYNTGINQAAQEGVNNGDGRVIISQLCDVLIEASANPICLGASITLSTNANSIQWNTGATSPTILVTPSVSTSYSVTGTGISSCSATVVMDVTVMPLPSLNAIVIPSVTCAGQSATVLASGAATYSLEPGSHQSPVAVVSPPSTVIYTLSGTSTDNCQNSHTFAVVVDNADLNVSGSTTVCNGQPAHLSASGALTYSWSNGATFQQITVHPSSTTVYTATGIDIHNCSISNTTEVHVNPLPVVNVSAVNTVVCRGEIVQLSASGADSYQWNDGAGGQTHDPVAMIDYPTTYVVTGTDGNGCQNSASVTITVDACSSVNETLQAGTSVFPNPTTGEFTVRFNDPQTASLTVTDIGGRIVLQTETSEKEINLDLGEFAKGVYFLKVSTQQGNAMIKVIRE